MGRQDRGVTSQFTVRDMEARLVRHADLVPCLNAFVDTRNPGSEAKENFTIIGPGVSENPAQHVHIREPHGFNVGGARQPPGCVNSQHSHLTAETFYVYSGQWRFNFGKHGDDVQVDAGPGTIASVPTGMFRGFTNIGDGPGFLWVVLGGDDPGRVTWAPGVFAMAERFGLKLLANGMLVDMAAGQTVPDGAALLAPPSAAELAGMATPPRAVVEACFVGANATGAAGALDAPGVDDAMIIGPGAPLDWPHGFTLNRLRLADGSTARFQLEAAEVLFVGRGRVRVEWPDGALDLAAGDTLSVPGGLPRRYLGDGELLLVRRGDATARPDLLS